MTAPTLDHPRRRTAGATARADEADAVELVHGTVVRWHQRGLLLRGPSGAGKSDLALRLIERGASLVADDLVRVTVQDGRPVARAAAEPGLLELRGQGIFRLPHVAATPLDLVVELGPAPAGPVERLPRRRLWPVAGIALPCFGLDPGGASATARIAVLATRERVY